MKTTTMSTTTTKTTMTHEGQGFSLIDFFFDALMP